MITTSVRRRAASTIAVAGAALMLTACSSSGNGLALPATDRTSVGTPGGASTGGTSTGGASARAGGSQPAGFTGSFCKDFAKFGDLSKIGSLGDIEQLISSWNSLAAEAPAEVKPAVQAVANFLQQAKSGQTPSTDSMTSAGEKVGVYIATKCH